MKNYFEILGVNSNASEEEIKKAYRSLAMKHHPDRGGDQNKFQEIQEAYSVLSDPNKRAEWDIQRNHSRHNPGGFHFNFNFGHPGDPFDVHDIFRNFQNGQDPFAQFKQNRRNRDLRVTIEMSLADTLNPQVKHISVRDMNGERETVTVEIPRGIDPNMQMKYAGHGDKSHKDLPPGDLYINFRIHQPPEFRIEGRDLIYVLKLNCIDAIIGTRVNIKGLDGTEFEVNIPVGIQNHSRLQIPHQGLYNLDTPIRGNLIISVEIFVPTNLTTEQLLVLENLSKELKDKTGTRS